MKIIFRIDLTLTCFLTFPSWLSLKMNILLCRISLDICNDGRDLELDQIHLWNLVFSKVLFGTCSANLHRELNVILARRILFLGNPGFMWKFLQKSRFCVIRQWGQIGETDSKSLGAFLSNQALRPKILLAFSSFSLVFSSSLRSLGFV